jgi:hypothetical protein
MELNYSKVTKYGMIKNNDISTMHVKYGRCLYLEDVNKYLFGVKENLINICNMDLVKKGIIFKGDEKYKIKINELDNYFDYVNLIIDFNLYKYYLPFNYYLLLNEGLPDFYQKIYNIFYKFKVFLEKDNSIDCTTIKSFIFGKNNYFKGYLSNEMTQKNVVENDIKDLNYTSSIIFDTNNGIFQISIGENLNDSKENYFDINKSYDSKKYEKLFEYVKEKILMRDERNYIIHNLTRVIGNKSIAEIIFDSYKVKNEFTIPVEELEKIIIFKNDLLRKDYKIFFMKLYENNSIYQTIDNNIYLNFEGFNKYLLNLNINYLQDFSIKEFINELYFSITNELIKSYENLFKFNKI